MTNDEIFTELRAICLNVMSVRSDQVRPQASLRGDLDADSLDLAEMSAAIEDVFGVVLKESDLKELETIDDVVGRLASAKAAVG